MLTSEELYDIAHDYATGKAKESDVELYFYDHFGIDSLFENLPKEFHRIVGHIKDELRWAEEDQDFIY